MLAGRGFADRFQSLRRKAIRETEWALLAGLTNPEQIQRIPFMEVGTGRFDLGYASRFWSAVLELDRAKLDALERSWRDRSDRQLVG